MRFNRRERRVVGYLRGITIRDEFNGQLRPEPFIPREIYTKEDDNKGEVKVEESVEIADSKHLYINSGCCRFSQFITPKFFLLIYYLFLPPTKTSNFYSRMNQSSLSLRKILINCSNGFLPQQCIISLSSHGLWNYMV